MNNADGTVTINFNIPTSDADAAIKEIEDRLKNLEGTQTDPKVGADTKEAKEAIRSIKAAFDDLPKNKQTVIEAIAKKQGFTSFQDALDHLPKDKLTKLKADAEKGKLNASEFGRAIKDIPRDHTTDVKVNDQGTPKLKEFVFSLKDAIKASMAYEVVQRALTGAMSLFGDVVSRYDTLNNYPKILEGMGASADGARKSIKTLKDGIMGLPTSLNEIAALNERVMPAMGGNIDKATKATLALNDAFVSSNATTEDTSRGMTQYIQMLESGKVDQMSWLTLVQTMNPALQKVAKSFGIANGSQHELYEEIKSGKISMQDLTERFAELDKGADGFHQQAKKSTAGIATAFTNMKTRIVNGLTDFLGSFDKAAKKITGSSIAENINKMSTKIGASLKSAGTYMGQLIPVFSVVGKAIKGVVTTIITFGKTLGMSFMANVDKVKKSNFDTFWKNVGKSVDSVFKALQPVAGALGGLVGVIAGAVWNTFKGLVSGIAKSFSDLKGNTGGLSGVIVAISQAFNAWYAAIKPLVKPLGEIIGSLASGVFKGIKGVIDGVAKSFSGFSSKLGDTSSSLKPVSSLLGKIASHKKGLEALGKAAVAVVSAFATFKAVSKAVAITKDMSVAIKGGIDTLKIYGIYAAEFGGKALKTIKSIHSIGDAFGIFKSGLVGGMTAIKTAFATNPVGMTLLAISLAITGVVLAIKHWGEIKKWLGKLGKWFSDTWSDITKGVSNFFGGIGKWFSKGWDGASSATTKAFSGMKKSTSSFFGGIGKWASKGWNSFMKTLEGWGKALSAAWNKVWSPVSKFLKKIWDGYINLIKGELNLIKNVIVYTIAFIVGLFVLAWRAIEKPFAAVWKGLVKVVTPPLKALGKFISSSINAISKTWNKVWKAVSKFFSDTWNGMVKFFTGIAKWFTKTTSSFLTGVQKLWNKVWGAISKFFFDTWNGMVKFFSGIAKWFTKNVTALLNGIQKAWSNVWNAISHFFEGIWDGIVKIYNAAAKIISKGISSFVKFVQNVWNSTWSAISNFFSGIWNGMVKFFTPIIHAISDTISNVVKGIQKVWNDVWGGIGSFFSGIWDGIKKAAESGINFVIDVIRTGLGAINAVLGFFGVKKVSLPHHVKFAQGGEMGADGTRLAMVNDDGTENYKELIHKKSTGQWLYTDKRNAILPLETGDRVYNGMQSKAIAQRYGIPGFASGGVIGSLWDGVKDASSWVVDKAEDVGKWIGDKWKAIVDWIAHPIKHVTELISNSIKGIVGSAPVKVFGELGSGIFGKAYDGIGKWIKSKLEAIKKAHDEETSGGNYDPAMIRKAAAEMHADVSDHFVRMLQATIQSESGGRNIVQQIHDINSGGNEARGILQYTPGTFAYYAMPGHTNIMNPYDQLLAFFNNSDWRNSIGNTVIWGHAKTDWLHSGPQGRRRFQDGGWSDTPATFGDADDSPEVAINPKRASADILIPEAIIARITANPNSPLTKLLGKNFETLSTPLAANAANGVMPNMGTNDKGNDDVVSAIKAMAKMVVQAVEKVDNRPIISAKHISDKAAPFTNNVLGRFNKISSQGGAVPHGYTE